MFGNICFDKEGIPEASGDGVELGRAVEEVDEVKQLLPLGNRSINRL